MKDKPRLLAALIGFATLFSACAEGPVGPPGPPGNANVYSINARFDLNADGVFSDFVANVSYDMPEFTPPVVDDGAVLVYIRDRSDTWTALPFTFGVEKIDEPVVDYTFTLGYAMEVGRLDVFVEASSNDDVVWDEILQDPFLGVSRQLKIVVIEGFFFAKDGPDLRDYEAVKAYYGLQE